MQALRRSLKKRYNHLEIVRIPLEARHLNSFEDSFKRTLYVFSDILDDRIIYYWCLNVLNIRFNLFRCIRCFDQNFGRFINRRVQREDVDNFCQLPYSIIVFNVGIMVMTAYGLKKISLLIKSSNNGREWHIMSLQECHDIVAPKVCLLKC